MKCACGNELGKPVVSPREWIIGGTKKGEEVHVIFMAGGIVLPTGKWQCYYCTFPLLDLTTV